MTNLLSFWKISIALIVLSFSFNCVNAQYCTPNFYNDWGDHIANVSTSGAIIDLNNNTGSDPNGYGDYSATHSVTAVAGTTFDINITYVSCWAGVSVWIDWDNSGTFEFSERVMSTDSAISPQISSITASNTTGSYRMRVIAQCFTNKPSNPCPSNGGDGEAEDYTLIVVEQNPCSGTLNAGTITINPTQANAGNTYIISATGQSLVDFDYTYQWQSNTNNQGWENVGSAMTSYADLTQTANTTQGTIVEYRLIVTCTNSNLFETSNIVSFKTHKEYCFPKNTYNGNILSVNNINKYIYNFSTSNGIVNISNLSGRSSEGYADYSATHQAMFNSGGYVNFKVNLTHVSSSTQHSIGIWIDWNNDGNFDSTERVYVSPGLIPWYTLSISDGFLIPSDISEGYYRMRVVHKLDDSLVDDPCFINYGDVEDYSLIVVSSFSCLPPFQLNSTPSSVNGTFLSWKTVGNETNFDVEWGNELFALGTGTKINGITGNVITGNSVLVNTITNKKYEFYVRTNCGNGNYSAWSGPFRFHTGYCVPEYINNQTQCGSITNFEINDAITNLANNSGVSPCSPESSYSDFTDMYAEANQGSMLSFTVKSSINGTSRISIWVDWNKNGVFDTNERLVNVLANTSLNSGYNGIFVLPSLIVSGNYRLRVRVVYYSNDEPQDIDPCLPYSYSQAEDYTLKIIGYPCIVSIPDDNFKNALLNHNPVIDLNGDGEIQCDEAEAFTETLNVSNENISYLIGIESFVNITGLDCSLNQLTYLEVSQNTALQYLNCGANQLTNLNISNTADLEWLYCHNNQLTNLVLSNNTNLEELYCYDNQLTSLDVSNNILLKDLSCYSNQLTSLDISNNTTLETLDCPSNQLLSLNAKNGNNSNIWYFDTTNNPNLICIEVGDPAWNTANWTNIDSQSCFSENCITPTFDEIGTICNGDTFVLDEDSQNGISGVWSPAIDNTQTQTYTFTPNTCANKTTITVTVNNFIPTPTGETSQAFTQGQTIADLVVSGSNLVWYSDSALTITIPTTTTLANATTYYVVSESGICKSSALEITAIDCSQVVSTPTGETSQTFTAGQTIADLVVNGSNLVWYSDTTYSLTLSQSEELVDGTTYFVVSESGICQSDHLIITVTQIVSRTDFDLHGFSYHPNPVNDVLRFSSNKPIENVVVSNMLGQQINTNLNSDNTILDMSNLPSGNYFVKITIEGISKTIKVMKN